MIEKSAVDGSSHTIAKSTDHERSGEGEEVRVDDDHVRSEQFTRRCKPCRLLVSCSTTHMLQAKNLDTDSASRE